MKRWYDTFSMVQELAFEEFRDGFKAYTKKLDFPESLNEGDYSCYFWAGFQAARVIANMSENDATNHNNKAHWVYRYDQPKVKIKRRLS